ncbi:MAG: PEP-CTERM sorting domain-containing protein [Akkermansiaceae bacterium]|nr:PEP-CTERM sorting domain-containing protein [Akkermansiaceae bacterium]
MRISTVPEPSSVLLAAFSGICLFRRKRATI